MGGYTAADPWEIGLRNETREAADLLSLGVQEVRRIRTLEHDIYVAPMLLLSHGFERMYKLSLILDHILRTSQAPERRHIRRYGHDLLSLHDSWLALAIQADDASEESEFGRDLVQIRRHPWIRPAFRVLSDYAVGARYYNIEVSLGAEEADSGKDPSRAWERLESLVLHEYPEWQAVAGTKRFNSFFDVVSKDLTAAFQRVIRAVALHWNGGHLGPIAMACSTSLRRYWELPEEKLHIPVPRLPHQL